MLYQYPVIKTGGKADRPPDWNSRTKSPQEAGRPTAEQERNGRPEAAFPYIPGNGVHRRPPTAPDCFIYTCEHEYPSLPIKVIPSPYPQYPSLPSPIPPLPFPLSSLSPPNPYYPTMTCGSWVFPYWESALWDATHV